MSATVKQLIAYLEDHYIEIVGSTETTITVIGRYTKDCVPFSQEDTIEATYKAVRAYLGY